MTKMSTKGNEAMEWISVKDRMPSNGDPVLVFYTRDEVGPCWFIWSQRSGGKMREDFKRLGFTHWMEITSPSGS
jgi:hypothetical protein